MAVEFDIEGKIAKITINKPKTHNSIDTKVVEGLANALKLCEDDEIKAVVLRGEGKSFCSGADLIEFRKFVDRGGLEYYSRVFHNGVIKRIRKLRKAVIVEAKGYVFGAGLSLLLASDYAVASKNAVFSSGFARIGLSPNTGSSFFLPRSIGFKKAFELMSTARSFDAMEALNLGIVNEVVEANLEERIYEVAKFYAAMPSKVIRYIKLLLDVSLSNTLEEHLILEEKLILDTAKTDEFLQHLNNTISKIKG
ncbi:2-(1,2-epoxy-1,2-dihydrophenyl)acetyl-CoA isomerase [Archaeoglobales archaeon]|nr:MAG: 2-(1,2-epoxy-1,2-dihydrophenyl)acetyl-CoA isomerase [Archaeoglobales archaeon]